MLRSVQKRHQGEQETGQASLNGRETLPVGAGFFIQLHEYAPMA